MGRGTLVAATLAATAVGLVGTAVAAAPRADVNLTRSTPLRDYVVRVGSTVGTGADGNLWVGLARTTAACGRSAEAWQAAVGTGIRWLTGGPAQPDAPAATASDIITTSRSRRLATGLGPVARDEGTWTVCAWLAVESADGSASTHDELRIGVTEDRLNRGLRQETPTGSVILPRRPAQFTLSAAARVTGARWQGWGTATATGTGTLVYGASPPRVAVPVRLRALRPGACLNRPVYTRVTYEVLRSTAGVPNRAPFDLVGADCTVP